MAGFNHNKDEVWTFGGERTQLSAVITGGASPTLADSNLPGGAAVSRPGVGKYRLTLVDMPANAATAEIQVTIEDTSFIDVTFNVDASALAASKTLDIYTGLAGVAANLASTARIHVKMNFKDTGVPKP